MSHNTRYWSFEGNCLNLSVWHATYDTPDARGWNYLADTEIVHPIGADNSSMFPQFNWSLADTAYFVRPGRRGGGVCVCV